MRPEAGPGGPSRGRQGLSVSRNERGLHKPLVGLLTAAPVPWVALSWLPAADSLLRDPRTPLTPGAPSCLCLRGWGAEGREGPGDCRSSSLALRSPSVVPSQRIQESCQSGTKWLVGTQVKARKRRRGAQTGSRPPAHTPGQKSPRLCGAAPASSALGPRERPCRRLSGHVGPRAHPQWRSRREPTFRSPYSSTEPLCSPR